MTLEELQTLSARIDELEDRLRQLPKWAFEEKEADKCFLTIAQVREKLDKVKDQVITVGLLGGTGVGKSTIINALAGEEISTASHRRPHTEKILMYHHETIRIRDFMMPNEAPVVCLSHNADRARSLILCDLPDFDSVRKEHRQRVLNFLDNLDMIVWVVSPEKYADQVFYDFLKAALEKKSPGNFYFLLNKADLICDSEENRTLLWRVVENFRGYLRDSGIDAPIVYAVSALEVFNADSISSWNQWELFEREIFREREIKEVEAIKEANLKQMLDNLSLVVTNCEERMLPVRRLISQLPEALKEHKQRMDYQVKMIVNAWADSFLKNADQEILDFGTLLVGPSRLIFSLVEIFSKRRQFCDAARGTLDSPPDISQVLKQLSNRLTSFVMSKNLPAPVSEELIRIWSFSELSSKWVAGVNTYLETIKTMGLSGLVGWKAFIFRLKQYLSFWIIALVFVASMGRIWELKEPFSWNSMLWAMLKCCERMFSLDGFGALLSFVMIEILVGCYFVSRYRKFLREVAQKFIETIEQEIFQLWDDFVSELCEDIRREGEILLAGSENSVGEQ
ncbi:MAG: 50S ribosome-binding GTPase [Deltaproteobacteria bacterium]|nr:50S ribosome-binding GTPase [Deltaproteobacteria bacterium]